MLSATITSHSPHLPFQESSAQSLRGRISKAAIGVLLATIATLATPWVPSAHASDVHFYGDGSTDNPFTSSGCTARPAEDECIVKFPTRRLSPLQNERIPSYRCPTDARYLLNRPSNRPGKAPNGVDVVASEGIDTWINPANILRAGDPIFGFAAGVKPEPPDTATNWEVTRSEGTYFVALFCTTDYTRSH